MKYGAIINPGNTILITGVIKVNNTSQNYIECSYEVYRYLRNIHNTFDLGLGFITIDSTTKLEHISQLNVNKEVISSIEKLDYAKKSFKLKARIILNSRSQQDNLDVAFYDYTMYSYLLSHYKYTSLEQLIEQVLDSNNDKDETILELFIDAKNEMDKKKNWYDIYIHFCQEIAVAKSIAEIKRAFKVYNEKFF
jgi:hypothetical protein